MTPHLVFSAFAATVTADARPYRDWLHAPIDPALTEAIRAHIRQMRALGEPRFQAMVEKTLNRPVVVRRRGRPARTVCEGTD